MKLGLTTERLRPGAPIFDGSSVYTRQILHGMPAFGWQVEPHLQPAYEKALWRGLWRAAEAPADIMHVTDYRVERWRCPVVATLYDAIPMAQPQFASQHRRALKNAVMRYVTRYADRIVCISAFAAEEVQHYYKISAERLSIIPCGIDELWLQALDPGLVAAVVQERGLRPGYVLAVGTLQPRKNFLRLLQAHQRLAPALQRQHPLLLIGRPGWACAELVAQLQAAEPGGTVRWLHDVASLQELRALYAGAALFALPSLHEGFGLPLLEAYASGLPALIHAGSSLPEVAGGAALAVDGRDVAALCRGMTALLEDAGERRERALRGRARAEVLTAQAMNQALDRLYRTLL